MNLSASVVNIKLYFSLFIFTIFISSYVLCMYDFFFIFFFFFFFFFFSSRRRHTRYIGDWSSDVCSSDLHGSRVGAIVFDARVRRILPPVAGRRGRLHLVGSLDADMSAPPGGPATALAAALWQAVKVIRRPGLLIEIGRASCRERVSLYV